METNDNSKLAMNISTFAYIIASKVGLTRCGVTFSVEGVGVRAAEMEIERGFLETRGKSLNMIRKGRRIFMPMVVWGDEDRFGARMTICFPDETAAQKYEFMAKNLYNRMFGHQPSNRFHA